MNPTEPSELPESLSMIGNEHSKPAIVTVVTNPTQMEEDQELESSNLEKESMFNYSSKIVRVNANNQIEKEHQLLQKHYRDLEERNKELQQLLKETLGVVRSQEENIIAPLMDQLQKSKKENKKLKAREQKLLTHIEQLRANNDNIQQNGDKMPSIKRNDPTQVQRTDVIEVTGQTRRSGLANSIRRRLGQTSGSDVNSPVKEGSRSSFYDGTIFGQTAPLVLPKTKIRWNGQVTASKVEQAAAATGSVDETYSSRTELGVVSQQNETELV